VGLLLHRGLLLLWRLLLGSLLLGLSGHLLLRSRMLLLVV
jgi:hypothetical protein